MRERGRGEQAPAKRRFPSVIPPLPLALCNKRDRLRRTPACFLFITAAGEPAGAFASGRKPRPLPPPRWLPSHGQSPFFVAQYSTESTAAPLFPSLISALHRGCGRPRQEEESRPDWSQNIHPALSGAGVSRSEGVDSR